MKFGKLTATVKDVGGIEVARLLPKGGKRTVGAWCFLDHIGPAVFSDGLGGMQVGLHPHIGLQTFTWMLEGEQLHRDSLGSEVCVSPGQLALMTAGTGRRHGICHTEQTPEGVPRVHAVQLWIALPPRREIAPDFEYHAQLPQWSEGGASFVLTTGSFAGRTAPTGQYSPLLGVDVRFSEAQTWRFPVRPHWEYGILVIDGEAQVGGMKFAANEMAVWSDSDGFAEIRAAAGTHIMLLGGEPLAEQVLMWWNFVAYSRDDLAQAVADWNGGHPRFGTIDLRGTGLQRIDAPDLPQTAVR